MTADEASTGETSTTGRGAGDYVAYSYLPSGSFPEFPLAPEFGRVPPYAGASLTEATIRML